MFAAGAGKKAESFIPLKLFHASCQKLRRSDKNLERLFIFTILRWVRVLLRLNIRRYLIHPNQVHYHGQELNTTTFNLARMNLILHGVDKERMEPE